MLTVDLENGFVQIEGSDKKTTIAPYPDQVKELMEAGGMLEWLRAAGKNQVSLHIWQCQSQ